MTENDIGDLIVRTAVDLHRALGPGLLESVYEIVLAHELRKHGLQVNRQVVIPIQYEGYRFEEGFCADLLIDGKVIVELKCVERLNNAHRKQLLTYLKFTGCRLGYLLNFSGELMRNGIVRTVNGLTEDPFVHPYKELPRSGTPLP
jgi:GxxExxY protein